MREEIEREPELRSIEEEFKKSLFFQTDHHENPLINLLNAATPNEVLKIHETYAQTAEVSPEFLRIGLFYLSNFPSPAYSDLDLPRLEVFFAAVSKKISKLCNQNDSFIQVVFSLFTLHQKTGGITLNMRRIQDFVLRENLNVHFQFMSQTELVSVGLYLSVLFQAARQDFLAFFEQRILPHLKPSIPQLETSELSQLIIMVSNFEYKK